MSRNVYLEKAREIPILARADVLVGGGGPAGLAAAASAARAGADVLLVERYGYLTGAHASAIIGTFCGIYNLIGGKPNQLIKGLTSEILTGLKSREGLSEPRRDGNAAIVVYDPFLFKQISEELVLKSGAQILMHAWIADVMMEGDRIRGVIIESKAGRQAILGEVVIDATGDADIAARAGAPFRLGEKGFTQFPSTMFRMENVNQEKAKDVSFADLRERIRRANETGEYALPREDGLFFITPRKGEVVCNVTTVSRGGKSINGTDPTDLTFAEIEGKRQAKEYERFFREKIPGFEEAFMDDTGQIGIRETRIIDGEYILKNNDVMEGRKFEDAIAKCCWPIEQHLLNEVKMVWLKEGDYYEIPYRCLLPQNVENLLVVGRCISAEHEAQASVRVAGPCFAEGEAAGVASAMAVKSKRSVRELNPKELRNRLLQNGADL
jgi:ribulose 1,5-bisphosphate synthetase/thiazole synthase